MNIKGIAGIIGAAVAVIFGLTIFFGSWYTVDQGERGVVLTNGAVSGEAAPGLHFKVPMVQSVEYISTQTQTYTYKDVKVYSKDQQPATLRVSVTLHATSPSAIYTAYKSLDGLVSKELDPKVPTWAENIFGQFNAANAVQERADLNNKLAIALTHVLTGRPFVIESVQIENIDFSGKYESAVEARMEATVKQQQATAEAIATKTRADAESYSTKVKGEGEAAAIRARGDALRENPGIPALIEAEAHLTAAQRWDRKLPETMVPGAGVPMLNIK